MMHSMKKRNNETKGWLSLKLDMSKAYDHVEWCFIDAMMDKVGFGLKWKKLVMDCISTPTMSILVN